MELKVNICTNESCKITIEDLTIDYQSENNSSSNLGMFRYSDTISIDILELIKADGNQVQKIVYSGHTNSVCPVTIPVEFDGWFKVHHIVLPTYLWFENERNREKLSILGLYKGVYFSDGENVYKYINKSIVSVPIEEIIERNTDGTTLSRYSEDYVSICFLRKCYINLCQLILNSRAFDKCSNKNKIDSELVFKRDMVWMAINVIKYMVEAGLLHEASRLIERLNSCNGLCANVSTKSSGCGCKNELWMQ